MRNADFFHNEAHVYNELLPRFKNIAPSCLFADKDEIVLEDLRSSGYYMLPRNDMLDFEHCVVVIKVIWR